MDPFQTYGWSQYGTGRYAGNSFYGTQRIPAEQWSQMYNGYPGTQRLYDRNRHHMHMNPSHHRPTHIPNSNPYFTPSQTYSQSVFNTMPRHGYRPEPSTYREDKGDDPDVVASEVHESTFPESVFPRPSGETRKTETKQHWIDLEKNPQFYQMYDQAKMERGYYTQSQPTRHRPTFFDYPFPTVGTVNFGHPGPRNFYGRESFV